MTPPLLFSAWFDGDSRQYPRLARVLEHTARRHCPGWRVDVRKIGEPSEHGRLGRFQGDNHRKLEEWARAVDEAPDGSGVLLLDADTFVNAPLDDLWSLDFDVAYTVRPAGARLPINAGVVAVRTGDLSRRFMRAWLATDAWFLRDVEAQKPWRKRYGGQNQSSLGYALESLRGFEEQFRALALPCEEWNCEDLCWRSYAPSTRIVHVKSALRMSIFNLGVSGDPAVRRLADEWRRLERESECSNVR